MTSHFGKLCISKSTIIIADTFEACVDPVMSGSVVQDAVYTGNTTGRELLVVFLVTLRRFRVHDVITTGAVSWGAYRITLAVVLV